MGSTIAFIVFAAGLGVAVWTIAATVLPQAERIAALLRHGVAADIPALPSAQPARARVTARAARPAQGPFRRAAA